MWESDVAVIFEAWLVDEGGGTEISSKAWTEEGESDVSASVGDMKPSSRTRRREAERMRGVRGLG